MHTIFLVLACDTNTRLAEVVKVSKLTQYHYAVSIVAFMWRAKVGGVVNPPVFLLRKNPAPLHKGAVGAHIGSRSEILKNFPFGSNLGQQHFAVLLTIECEAQKWNLSTALWSRSLRSMDAPTA